MDLGGANWAIINIVGPAILALVLLWAVLRNRKSRDKRNESERGTSDLYDREEAARREDDGER
jgi:membrane protein implicated in regulation of membrane protease activity